MLAAKLFASLAILQLGLALLESRTSHQSIDVHFHATYIALRILYLHILLAVTSACFALIYFGASRWVLRPLSKRLGLAHLVIATVGFFFLSISLSGLGSVTSAKDLPVDQALNQWHLLYLLVGGLCFLFGCALFALNLVWTAITAFRSH
jgi:heme/copper-type cytochrome/quinol oxidase subunit 1